MIKIVPWIKNRITNPCPPANAKQLCKDRFLLLLVIAAIYFILILFKIGCPFLSITGILCPGCGMTRAIIRALRLDFAGAWLYHPLFFTVPVILLLLLFGIYLRPRLQRLIWIILGASFLLTYLLRLFSMVSA